MSWLGNILSGLFGGGAASPAASASIARMAEWEHALFSSTLPSFVAERLDAVKSGKAPWVATMSAAELGLARSKGIRPLAMVSGTCWFHYGYSWTRGHSEGWHRALSRLQKEAQAVGANAVVDVKMRKVQLELSDSMDFTLVGTAVRIDGLPAGQHPVVATVPALEFVRLLEAGIVPVGIAVGAQYSLHTVTAGTLAQGRLFTNKALPEVGNFWEGIRRHALLELRRDAQRQGNGVLAHTHLGQLLKIEGDDNRPTRLLGRHIVIGTVVDTPKAIGVPHDIRTVIDMRDELSPLSNAAATGHNAYPVQEEEGAI